MGCFPQKKFFQKEVDLFSNLNKHYLNYQQMNAPLQNNSATPVLPEQEILQAIRGIRFGLVEIVVHESRVTEIRQTRRVRLPGNDADKISPYPTTGG